MCYVCKIIFFLIPFISFAGDSLDLSIRSETTEAIYTTTKSFTGESKMMIYSINYYHDAPSKKKISYWISPTIMQNDFSNYFLRDKAGSFFQYTPKSSTFIDVNAGVSGYFNKKISYTLDASSSIGRDELASQSFSLGLTNYLYGGSTLLTFVGSYSAFKNIESYYSDPADFQIKKFPIDIVAYSFSSSWEQVLGKKLKMILTGKFKTKSELTPSTFWLSNKFSYALSGEHFVKVGYKLGSENTSQEYNAPFGTFQNNTFSFEYTWEPILELLVSLAYDLDLEVEDNKKNNTKTLRSFDQFGFGIQYTIDDFTPYIKASFTKSNTDDDNTQLIGGLKWEF